jgi:ligand-binding sensor domain-containing protein/DNA-binding response OmpR family regulator
MKIISIALTKICCLLTIAVFGQPKNLKFRQIGTNSGLSNSIVQTIYQDGQGFMWFGTRDGLNKYDGYKFTTYKRNINQKLSISSNDIKGIVEDRDNHLWLATADGGMNELDLAKDIFIKSAQKSNMPLSSSLQYLYKDRRENLWVCSSDKGLYVYNRKSGYYKHYKNIPSIACVTEDNKGNIWVGSSSSGIFVINPQGKIDKLFNTKDVTSMGLSDNHIRFIRQDRNKTIWVGTYGGGLNQFNAQTGRFTKINLQGNNAENGISNFLLCMEEDLKGNLWIGSENGGLSVYNPINNRSITYFHIDNDFTSVGSNSINHIKRDLKGNMWLGTTNAGITLVSADESNFVHYKHEQSKNSLSNNIVNTIFEDSEDRMWVGTDGGGLNLFNPQNGTFKYFTHQSGANSICGNYVLSINEDAAGNIWLGTWGNGITVFNYKKQTYKHYKNNPSNPRSLSSNYAFFIFKDSRNRMWVGTYGGGLNLYDDKSDTFTTFTNSKLNAKSISSNHILCIAEDKASNIWIGTDGGGLNRFNEKEKNFTAYTPSSGDYPIGSQKLSNSSVTSITTNKNGRIWIGTNYGLNEFNPLNGFNKAYYVENGLPNDAIGAVVEDGKGHLWISTNKGISHFNISAGKFENFSTADGLQADEFKYAKCVDHLGQIYFGGRNGFNVFNPEKVKPISFDPPILLTRFQLFNEDVNVALNEDDPSPLKTAIDRAKKIVLSYEQSSFSFEFVSLNYTSNEQKQYQYKLEGFDNKWHKLGNRNTLTYTNLDPGKYRLSVKGLKNNKEWSDRVASIEIIITPPFWNTWWFKALCIVVLAGIIIGIFYLRLSNIKQRNRQLKKQVGLRTQELSESNSFLLESNEKIKLQNENLEEVNKEIVRKTDKILLQQKQIIQQNQQLESAVNELEVSNQTKDKFFSILAHDLKNPISALNGLSELLKNRLNILGPAEISSYVHNLNRSSNAVNALVINLLDWSRTQSKKIHHQPTHLNLHELVTKNVYLAQIQLNNKSINCLVNIDSTHMVYADYQMINTVIRNILGNSIKFTPINGQIEVFSELSSHGVDLIIKDNGIGMSQEQISQIGNLQSAGSLGTVGETGTGLGMQICSDFIARNNGILTIKSLPGKGSEFIISLQGTSKEQSDQSSSNASYYIDSAKAAQTENKVNLEDILPRPHRQILKGRRILIVDDNQQIRNYLKLLLSDVFEIFEAEDGKDGLSKAIENQPDLIISDLIMPVMDGLEFCYKIKKDILTSHIPIIMLTGEKNQESQISSYESGADIYVNKPINSQILLRVIFNLINNKDIIKRKFAVSDTLIPEDLNYNKIDKDFLQMMSSFIEENLSQADLDYKKLSEHAAMSRTVLYAKFKTLTGMGVHDFIKNIRLKNSLKHLQEGKLNIGQIAYEVGFATPSYFSKSFTKEYKLTPKEYVASLKKSTTEAR